MNVIYLTTHILDADFASLNDPKLNPAGQNFHGKLIRALGVQDDVKVYSLLYSLTPSIEPKRVLFEEHIFYSYVRGSKNRYVRALTLPPSLSKRIVKDNKGLKDNVILFDSLNATLGKTAIKVAKALKCPLIAILTDEIGNITGVTPSVYSRIHKLVKNASASISLTDGLVRSYDLVEKPHYLQPIFVEDVEVTPYVHPRPYIYYGGALFAKDGVQDLLDAYPRFQKDYDLIISGHGPMEDQLKERAAQEEGIHFLGQIPKEEHYAYIAGCAIAINARHYVPGLDATSVPSKVMEYLTYAPVVVSSLSTPIKMLFDQDINWIDSDLETFLDERGLKELAPNKAKEKLLSLFGKEASSTKLHEFLLSVNA